MSERIRLLTAQEMTDLTAWANARCIACGRSADDGAVIDAAGWCEGCRAKEART